MDEIIDYGRKPGKIPPSMQIRPSDENGLVPEFVTVECEEWIATYQLNSMKHTPKENFYNLYSVEILT